MTTPLWCLAIGCVLPYVWAMVGHVGRAGQVGRYDNRLPRAQEAQCTGWVARAYAAHSNAFEAVIVFAPAVVVAHLAGADALWAARLAAAWVVLRTLHGLVYLADLHAVRTAVFFAALGCDVGLFAIAARAG